MSSTQPKFIGKRISFVKTKDQLSVIISQEVPRWKESLLLAWLLAWTFCGGFFIVGINQASTQNERLFLAVVLAFWAFFLVRIGKAFLWRKGGREMIRITPGQFSIKNAWWNYGKAKIYYLDNIKNVSLIPYNPKNFMESMDRSFWIIGGETIAIKYLNKELRIGKQLEEKNARQLIRVLEKGISEFKKK